MWSLLTKSTGVLLIVLLMMTGSSCVEYGPAIGPTKYANGELNITLQKATAGGTRIHIVYLVSSTKATSNEHMIGNWNAVVSMHPDWTVVKQQQVDYSRMQGNPFSWNCTFDLKDLTLDKDQKYLIVGLDATKNTVYSVRDVTEDLLVDAPVKH